MPSWQEPTFTMTEIGNDHLSFRENEPEIVGAVLDHLGLVAG